MPGRETKQTVHKVTPAERTVVDKHFARREAKPWVRFKVSKNENGQQIEIHHPDKLVGEALVMEALASADGDFVNGIVSQLADASGHGQDISDHGLNFMLSVIKGIEPRDQLEAMLAAQMAAVHVASMTFARRLAHVEEIPQQDSAERAFNKLTRTFAMQMEALKRYRSGAEQKVTLQHVSVAEGGQAIVGNVTQVPRENRQEQPAQEQPAQEQPAQEQPAQEKAAQEKAAREKGATPPPPLPDTNVVPMTIMGKSKQHDPVAVRRKSTK